MVSTKDLRDMFSDLTNQAGKRAGDALSKAEMPDLSSIGRREPPALLWFGIGLTLGALIGMLAAFLSSPYNGEQARQKISEQVEKVRKPREEVGTNGSPSYVSPTSPTTAYERS